MAPGSGETKQLRATGDTDVYREGLSSVHKSTGQQTQLRGSAHAHIRQMVWDMSWRNPPWSGSKHHLSVSNAQNLHLCGLCSDVFTSPRGGDTCITSHWVLKQPWSKPLDLELFFPGHRTTYMIDLNLHRKTETLQPEDTWTGVRCLVELQAFWPIIALHHKAKGCADVGMDQWED